MTAFLIFSGIKKSFFEIKRMFQNKEKKDGGIAFQHNEQQQEEKDTTKSIVLVMDRLMKLTNLNDE